MSQFLRVVILPAMCLLGIVAATGVVAEDKAQTPGGSENQSKTFSLWTPGDPGERLYIDGQVVAVDGKPVVGAELHIRQADGAGVYTDSYSGRIKTVEDGRYAFGTVLPGQQTSPKHIHIMVIHPGYESLTTEILFKGDPNLDPATERDEAIFLEEVGTESGKVKVGRFEIVLRPL